MTTVAILKLVVAILSIGVMVFGWFRVRRIINDRVRIKELERQHKSLRAKTDALQTAADTDIDTIRQRLRERAGR